MNALDSDLNYMVWDNEENKEVLGAFFVNSQNQLYQYTPEGLIILDNRRYELKLILPEEARLQ